MMALSSPIVVVSTPPAQGTKHKYQVTIVMPGGLIGKAWGLYATQWEAIDSHMDAFADARRISARRLS